MGTDVWMLEESNQWIECETGTNDQNLVTICLSRSHPFMVLRV
jgi:hypothetical protein